MIETGVHDKRQVHDCEGWTCSLSCPCRGIEAQRIALIRLSGIVDLQVCHARIPVEHPSLGDTTVLLASHIIRRDHLKSCQMLYRIRHRKWSENCTDFRNPTGVITIAYVPQSFQDYNDHIAHPDGMAQCKESNLKRNRM